MKIKLKDNLGKMKGRVRIITTDSITGEIKRISNWYDNMIMLGANTGKDLILDRMNGVNTYSLNITHIDIGDDNTSPSASDTALGNAVARASKVTGVVSGNSLTLRFFFASADLTNGNYYEVGTYVDGSAGVDTGQIFNHALFGSVYAKGTNEDTTLEVVFSIT
jgi:hypothetical protein